MEKPRRQSNTLVQVENAVLNCYRRLLLKPNQQQKQDDEANKMDEVVPLRKTNININGIGTHNGQSILEVDLDDQEEKPWRRPGTAIQSLWCLVKRRLIIFILIGADITDYFNYGFNEQTWKLYCMKQKELREEMGMHKGKSLFDRIADDMGVPVGGQFEMKHEPRYEQQSQTGRRSAGILMHNFVLGRTDRPILEGGSSRPEKRHYDDRSDYQHSDQHRVLLT